MASSSAPDSPAISKSLLDNIVPPPPGWKPPRSSCLFFVRHVSHIPGSARTMRKMIKASLVRSVEFENHPNVEVPNKKLKLSASEDTTKDSIVEVRKNEDEDCRWSSPKDSKRLDKICKDSIPKATVKQAQWALSIWRDWAQYRKKKLVEQSECEQDLNE